MDPTRHPYADAHDAWADGVKSLDLAWQDSVLRRVAQYDRGCSPRASADALRGFVRSALLSFDDMQKQPERFFAAHRLLASRILGGFGIRFTVQYNLFAGSILGLGGDAQVAALAGMQRRGELGCFALTEVGAGVLSGFIVNATAKWNARRGGFIIATPDAASEKNWISQGLTADWVVVFANLHDCEGKNHGPHPFLLRMRSGSSTDNDNVLDAGLTPGITVTDMGRKSIANDLDNARIRFDGVFAPRNSLLNRFCEVTPDGAYRQIGQEKMRIEVIGQRLLTGRLAIAESALVSVRQLFLKAKKYADNKPVNSATGPRPLSGLPHLHKLFCDADDELTRLETFSSSVEARLCACLRSRTIPDANLVEAISVTKIRNIEMATHFEHQLEQELGSYALMAESGFIYKDMLLCCKFAEGDSRILLQKVARDELRRVQKAGMFRLVWRMLFDDDEFGRAKKAFWLGRALQQAPSMAEGFVNEWEQVYSLANAVCDHHLHHEKPDSKEVSRMLENNPHLLKLTVDPLLVSRL
jgi:acyl-CoA oxidase